MTKTASPLHSCERRPVPRDCEAAASELPEELPAGGEDRQRGRGESSGLCRLLAESGVTHVHGMEILRLVKVCAGAYDRILAERMRDEDISLPQWRILIRLYLAERDGQPALSPTDLAHSQCLSKNTISAHLRALEDFHLIERQLDPNDLRAFRIRLTPGSRGLLRASTPLHIGFLNELIDHLSAEECEGLQTLLEKLAASLQRERGGSGGVM